MSVPPWVSALNTGARAIGDAAFEVPAEFWSAVTGRDVSGAHMLGAGQWLIDPPSKVESKPKRKPSKYNREYSRNFKKLKKQHPRSSFATLTKKAHKMTRVGKKNSKKRRR